MTPRDEAPPAGEPDPNGADWLVLQNDEGISLAFQQVDDLPPPTWPEAGIPQQLHLDTTVRDVEALTEARDHAVFVG